MRAWVSISAFCQIVPGLLVWDREVVGSNPTVLIFKINHLRVSKDARFSFAVTFADTLNVDIICILPIVFEDVAVYNTRVMGAAHVENVANLACHTALSYRGGAHTNLPADLQKQEGGERSKSNIPHHTSDVFARLARLPADDDLVPAADGLNTGRKIALLCGLEALNATDELEQTAEVLGASIVKVPLGEAAVPDSSPYTMGGIGLLGTRPSQEAMKECDMLLMVGTSFPYIKLLTKPG